MSLELTTTIEGTVKCYRPECRISLYTRNKAGVTNLAALKQVAINDGWRLIATTFIASVGHPVEHLACPDHYNDHVAVVPNNEGLA